MATWYHDPKTGKTVQAKNRKEAREKMKPRVIKPKPKPKAKTVPKDK